MATGSETTLNLTASHPVPGWQSKYSKRGGTKSFSNTPNPADSGVLGHSTGEPAVTDPTKDNDALTEPALKEFFNDVFTIADTTRRPRKIIWDKCWDLYDGTYDWSPKAWWQSRANIPKVRASIDRAISIFRKSLLRLHQFYNIQSDSKQGKAKGMFTIELLNYWLDQINGIEEILTGTKSGLITSTIILKVWWQSVREQVPEVTSTQEPIMKFGVETGAQTKRDVKFSEKARGKLGVKAVDPFNFWVVPKTNRFACIERFYTNLNEIETLVNKGVYLQSAIDKAKNYTDSQSLEKVQESKRAGELPTSSSKYLREIEGYHYWGDIYNDKGRIVMPSASFSMIGKDILLRAARPIPFYHKRPPYIVGTPYTVPFSTYNRGMVEDVAEIANSITQLTNLIIDGAMYDALKMFGIDVDSLEDPSQANDGVYPGKVWITKSTQVAPGTKPIQTVEVGHIPIEAMNALAVLKQGYQEGTYENEWVSGQGGTAGRTLGEVNLKTQSALEGLDEAARNIELTVIEPTLDMIAKTIYQFHKNYSLPTLLENYPNVSSMLADLSPAERYAIMIGGYDFKARGLSVGIEQQQRLGEIGNFITILSHVPGLLQRLDPDELLEAIMLPLSWNTEKLILSRSGQPPNPTPLVPGQEGAGGGQGGLSPAQASNAQQGAVAGGAVNNPMAAQAPGGGGQGQPPNQMMGKLLQMVMGGRR